MLKSGDKVGIVCCSNGQPISNKEKIEELLICLRNLGLNPICSHYIYQKDSVFSGTGRERAEALMNFFQTDDIKAIFDISGGDIANEILSYLDFDEIGKNFKPFWGYSDLTTILNAIYSITGKAAYLYQIRNLISEYKKEQIENFSKSIFLGEQDLYKIEYEFIQGDCIKGIVIGGNIRCFLKLAGTPYLPDFKDKILFLESFGGKVPKMITYLSQLKQMNVFNQIGGIVLGTFSEMEEKKCNPTMEELVVHIVNNPHVTIAKTREIGHRSDSKCLVIGSKICWKESDKIFKL